MINDSLWGALNSGHQLTIPEMTTMLASWFNGWTEVDKVNHHVRLNMQILLLLRP